jgi:hypothetical protein
MAHILQVYKVWQRPKPLPLTSVTLIFSKAAKGPLTLESELPPVRHSIPHKMYFLQCARYARWDLSWSLTSMTDMYACPSCHQALIPGSSFCSNCGLQLRPPAAPAAAAALPGRRAPQKLGRRGKFLLFVGLFIVLYAIIQGVRHSDDPTSNSSSSSAAKTGVLAPKQYYIGDNVAVGYWSYRINGIQWRSSFGEELNVERPDAQFLVLDLSVRNNDKTVSTLPPIKLVNAAGQEFSVRPRPRFMSACPESRATWETPSRSLIPLLETTLHGTWEAPVASSDPITLWTCRSRREFRRQRL